MANRTYILSGGSQSQLNILCKRYSTACAHNFTVSQLSSWKQKSVDVNPDSRMLVPLVLRYHPLFAKAVSAALAQVPVPREACARVVPSWKNSLPSLQQMLQKHNKKSCRDKGNREGVCFLSSSSSSSSGTSHLNNTNTHGFNIYSIARLLDK